MKEIVFIDNSKISYDVVYGADKVLSSYRAYPDTYVSMYNEDQAIGAAQAIIHVRDDVYYARVVKLIWKYDFNGDLMIDNSETIWEAFAEDAKDDIDVDNTKPS